MSKENLYLGKSGEDIAADFLKRNGYKIVARNFKTGVGEIDIVANHKDTVCFIEVKTRNSNRFGSGLEAVNNIKQRQISKAALSYLKQKKLFDKSARFDVVSLVLEGSSPEINLIQNAFELNYGL